MAAKQNGKGASTISISELMRIKNSVEIKTDTDKIEKKKEFDAAH